MTRERPSRAPSDGPAVTAVLWDIDGTLLTSGGVASREFVSAVEDVVGLRPDLAALDFGGRIDPEIAGMLLTTVGRGPAFVAPVLARLEERVAESADLLREHTRPLGGVLDLVGLLGDLGVHQTVVTGNLQSVARLKLAAAGLIPPIVAEFGGFGDSGPDRAAVAAFAVRALTTAGWAPAPDTCWIVGDTPRDLACARAIGVRCALVGTGRLPAEALSGLGADLVLDTLEDPRALLDAWRLS